MIKHVKRDTITWSLFAIVMFLMANADASGSFFQFTAISIGKALLSVLSLFFAIFVVGAIFWQLLGPTIKKMMRQK